jgi:hypothetical protein
MYPDNSAVHEDAVFDVVGISLVLVKGARRIVFMAERNF